MIRLSYCRLREESWRGNRGNLDEREGESGQREADQRDKQEEASRRRRAQTHLEEGLPVEDDTRDVLVEPRCAEAGGAVDAAILDGVLALGGLGVAGAGPRPSGLVSSEEPLPTRGASAGREVKEHDGGSGNAGACAQARCGCYLARLAEALSGGLELGHALGGHEVGREAAVREVGRAGGPGLLGCRFGHGCGCGCGWSGERAAERVSGDVLALLLGETRRPKVVHSACASRNSASRKIRSKNSLEKRCSAPRYGRDFSVCTPSQNSWSSM